MIDGETLQLVRDSARSFVDAQFDHATLRSGRNRLPWWGQAHLAEMASLGWFSVLIPEAQGGLGLDLAAACGVARELGRGLLGEPFVPLAVLAPLVVLGAPESAAQRRVVSGIANGSRPVALAWQGPRTTVRDPLDAPSELGRDGEAWRLTTRRRYVAGAWAASDLLVPVSTGDGVMLVVVPLNREGVTVEQDWRADGSPAGDVRLSNVVVAESDILARGEAARAAVCNAIDRASVVASAEMGGVMDAALEMTLTYLRTRKAFGRPIGSFQALQHSAGRLYVQQQMAQGVLEAALAALEEGGADLPGWAARTKTRANDAALEITKQSIQLHGAIGFTDECDIGLYLKRAVVLSAWLGSSAEQRRRLQPYDATTLVAARKTGSGGARPQGGWATLSDDEFRSEASAFFAAHLPEKLKFRPNRLGWSEIGDWYLFLSSRGWLAPGWPERFEGMALSPAKHLIYFEEMERVGAPRLLDHGINNVGSILIAKGSEEQQRTYLPKVLSGEHIWCQGYSEPNAGSDLASLRTKARVEGDTLVIDGQKIWTTLAHEANHMYALVRTDPEKPGRDGISFVLIDLRQKGVTVRPIRNIAGHAEFCEVFLDGVTAPLSDVVGDLNDGWAVSRAVLGFERLRVGAPRNAQMALGRLVRAARTLGLANEPLVRASLIDLTREVADLAALYQRAAQQMASGRAPGPEASVLKIWATETEQAITEAQVRLLGDLGTLTGAQDIGDHAIDTLTPFLSTRASTIYGGTNEIQLNIIAKRVLGL